ncbi:unnamed protein product [Heterobilharzia americana]|nr:unnamed protein product [Heterobilharzia americana]
MWCSPLTKPHHHGISEGIIHVNPLLIPIGSYVFAEVSAKYRYVNTDLDSSHCEMNEVVFHRCKQILPLKNYFADREENLRNLPHDLDTHSIRIRELYNKSGGPVSDAAMRDENLYTSGTDNNTHARNTFIPQTQATKFLDIQITPMQLSHSRFASTLMVVGILYT